MCFGTSLKRKRPQRFSLVQTVENIAKEAIKAYVIDRKITWVSSHRYPITKRSNRTPLIGHPCDKQAFGEPIMIELQIVIDTIKIIIVRVISNLPCLMHLSDFKLACPIISRRALESVVHLFGTSTFSHLASNFPFILARCMGKGQDKSSAN